MFQLSQSASPKRPSPGAERPLALVIDPDHSARAVLEVALARDGFDVWSVETADNGLAVLGRGRTPDVIVLETALRGGDGFSFCAELRGNPRTAHVPVVLLAAADDQNVSNLAEVVGVDEYVTKPAFARDVAALVRFELVRYRTKGGHTLRFAHRTIPASHLLRALLTSSRQGVLQLAAGRGTLSFRDGVIVHARFGEQEGVDALVRALALTVGEYSVTLAPVSVSAGFSLSLRDYVALVLPRLARWTSLVQRSLPLDAVLAVDFNRLAQALPTMPDDVNRIVQLFDGRRPVNQVLLDSPFDHALTLEVGTRLYLMGVIGPVTPDTEPTAGRPAPKFFEPRSSEAEELMRQLFDGSAEIRSSDVAAVPEQGDWAVMGAAKTGLEVEDPAGGWTTTALPDAHLLDGLDPASAQQVAAFKVPTVVEAKEPLPGVKEVSEFAKDGPETGEGGSIDDAILAVTGGDIVDDLDPDPTPPSPNRRFGAEDRQERLITPTLVPVVAAPVVASAVPAPVIAQPPMVKLEPAKVELAKVDLAKVPAAALAPAPTVAPAPAFVSVAPVSSSAAAVTSRPAPLARINDEDSLEGGFFSSEAGVQDSTAFEDTVPTQAGEKKSSKLGLLIGLVVAAVVLAIGVEYLRQSSTSEPEPVAAPAALVAEEPAKTPEPAVLEPVAAVEEEPAAQEPALDVSESLSEGVKAYQAGQYQKAVAVLEQVVADDPKSVQGWLVLGQARYDAGQTQGAKDAAAKVIELDPKNGKVHLLLATIAHDAGDSATKRSEVEKYLELDPNGEHVAEAKALLTRP